MSAPDALATASGSAPSPVVSETKTGAGVGRGRRDGAGGEQRCDRAGQRVVLARRGGERREGRGERQVFGPARVHAAEQRVDQPVDDLGAEPGADVLGDGDVAGLSGQLGLVPRPRDALGGDDPGGRKLVQVGGHAHELPAGQRPHRAPGVDGGRGDAGRDKGVAKADCGDQLRALRPPGEQGLCPLVDGNPGDIGGSQLPADATRALEDGDPDPAVPQIEGRGQSGNAATDHRHVRRRVNRHGPKPATTGPRPAQAAGRAGAHSSGCASNSE